MIREKTETTSGKPLEFVRPENEADTQEITKAARAGNIAVGVSFGDMQDDVDDADLVEAGVLPEDEEE